MKNLMLILLIALLFSCKKNNDVKPSYVEQSADPIQLFIFNGESNAGGVAANNLALPSELLPQPQIQIWNNLTNKFDTLIIGVNNLLGHYVRQDRSQQLTDIYGMSIHGWELGLSNIIKNRYPTKIVYLVKTGAGGARIDDLDTNTFFFHITKNRIDSAITELKKFNRPIQIFVFYSQGINDAHWTPVNIWEDKTIIHFKHLRDILGVSVPIIMCKHQDYNNDFNVAMEEICLLDPTRMTSVIESTGATVNNGDPGHYDYQGTKLMANRLFLKIEQYIK